jgi:16S rRNA (guanine527-N7)-methyltransferase
VASPEPRPAVATQLFGDRVEQAERFAAHLCTTGVEWGLIGPREVPRIWSRHILNCAIVSELMPPDASVIDVGSGAGLPGLALLLARPDLRMTLVEPFERRTEWLSMVAADLGLDVRIVRARAEEVDGAESAALVTARAVAPLERLARWGLPLVDPGGELLAIKGRTAQQEVDSSLKHLRRLGATDVSVVQCGVGVLETPTTVVRVRVKDGPSRTKRSKQDRRA